MSKTAEELLQFRVGGKTVADNVRRAIEAKRLVEEPDGLLRMAEPRTHGHNWAKVKNGPPLSCDFLMHFLFREVYAKSAVPHGCRACYKVKVVPRTLRELVAAWGIGKKVECRSKWGVDLHNPYSQGVYAGYFYTEGLDGARAVYRVVRDIVDAHPLLGPDVTMTIKRGCSEYEAALGPSDQYTFAPELEELEAYLRSRFRSSEPSGLPPLPMAHWLDVAFRIGDDTYLDFTHGKRLRPKTITYEP